MTEFFQQIFKVAWACLSIKIPITSTTTVTPWQLMLFTIVLAMLLRYLFNKGQTE